MKTRSMILGFLLACSVTAVARPADDGPVVVSSARYPLSVGGTVYDLITDVQILAPGTGTASREWGDYVLVTVLSGAVTLREVNRDVVIGAGQSLVEAAPNLRSLQNAGPGQVRLVLSAFVPRKTDAAAAACPAGAAATSD